MATTFVGIELGGERVRSRHAAVVLQRRKGSARRGRPASVDVCQWSCLMGSEEELLENLTAWAGKSGVIAVHGQYHAGPPEASADLLKRVWRVLDYRLLFALAPRHRTRALVRVEPAEVQKAFASPLGPPLPPGPSDAFAAFPTGPDASPPAVLDGMRAMTPAVDFSPLVQHLARLRPGNTQHGGASQAQNAQNAQHVLHAQIEATVRAALSAYAGLWCWWHGPAGYDVLGAGADSYRLAPRLMDVPDTDATPF